METSKAPLVKDFAFVNLSHSVKLDKAARKLVKRQANKHSVERRLAPQVEPENTHDTSVPTADKPESFRPGPGGSRRWRRLETEAHDTEQPARKSPPATKSKARANGQAGTTQPGIVTIAEPAFPSADQQASETTVDAYDMTALFKSIEAVFGPESYTADDEGVTGDSAVAISQSTLGRTFHTSSIQSGPGVVCFDPFHTLPMRYSQNTMRYMHHCYAVVPKESLCNLGRWVWFDLMKDDLAICNVVACHISLWHSVMRGEAHTEASFHRATALQVLRQKIKNFETDKLHRNHVITSIAILVMTESLSGEYRNVEIHFKALQRMVNMCGGLKPENFPPTILTFLYNAYDAAECALAIQCSTLGLQGRIVTTIDFLCIGLNIMANCWRRPENRPKIMTTGPAVLKHLIESIEGGLLSTLSSQINAHHVVWVLVIAYLGSTDVHRAWFLAQLVEVCYALKVTTWAEVYLMLDRNYWSPGWDQPRGSLWKAVEADLLLKRQVMADIGPGTLIAVS